MPVKQLNNFFNNKICLLTVYLVALALLIYSVFNVYLRIQEINNLKPEVATTKRPSMNTDTNKQSIENTRKIASYYLFGKKNNSKATPVEYAAAPVTRLNLTLHGVVAGNETGVSIAIISIDGKLTSLFSVGDKIPNSNAEIHNIQPGKILLIRNGKLESLVINRPELKDINVDRIIKNELNIDDKLLMLPEPQESAVPDPQERDDSRELIENSAGH